MRVCFLLRLCIVKTFFCFRSFSVSSISTLSSNIAQLGFSALLSDFFTQKSYLVDPNVVIIIFFPLGSCLNCSTIHGECVKGFCVCDLGWEGRSCELEGYAVRLQTKIVYIHFVLLSPHIDTRNGCFKDFINELRSHSIGLFEQVGFCLFRV